MSEKHSEYAPNFRLIHYFFILAALSAGGMFVFKLFSFMKTIKKDELAGFAFDPIITYAFVAMGFLFLLGWAYLTGQFHDIEKPKYDMLKRVREQELAEGLDRWLDLGGEDGES